MKLVVIIPPNLYEDDFDHGTDTVPVNFNSKEELRTLIDERAEQYRKNYEQFTKDFTVWYKKVSELQNTVKYKTLNEERLTLWRQALNRQFSDANKMRVEELDEQIAVYINTNVGVGPDEPETNLVVGKATINLAYDCSKIVILTLEEWFEAYS